MFSYIHRLSISYTNISVLYLHFCIHIFSGKEFSNGTAQHLYLDGKFHHDREHTEHTQHTHTLTQTQTWWRKRWYYKNSFLFLCAVYLCWAKTRAHSLTYLFIYTTHTNTLEYKYMYRYLYVFVCAICVCFCMLIERWRNQVKCGDNAKRDVRWKIGDFFNLRSCLLLLYISILSAVVLLFCCSDEFWFKSVARLISEHKYGIMPIVWTDMSWQGAIERIF